jgi:hypothetical protein
MTDVVERMWFAHLLLTSANPDKRWTSANPDERWAIDEAERLLHDLPPSGTRDDALDMVEPARGGDVEARRLLASFLDHLRWLMERARDAPTTATKPRSERKPSVRKLIKQAEESGKQVTSVTTPDGVTLKFGEREAGTTDNPWDEVLRRGPH